MIEHKCDKCHKVEAEECYCLTCFSEAQQTAFDEGYEAAKAEFDVKSEEDNAKQE